MVGSTMLFDLLAYSEQFYLFKIVSRVVVRDMFLSIKKKKILKSLNNEIRIISVCIRAIWFINVSGCKKAPRSYNTIGP